MGKVKLDGYQCERCEHIWVPRRDTVDEPTICPECKSPYWNKPRKVDSFKKIAVLKHFKNKRQTK